MTGVVKSETLQAYDAELKAYQLRLAAWLGIDPHQVAKLDEKVKPLHDATYGIPQPPDLLVSWESYGEPVEADEHVGRHPLPVSMRGFSDEPPTFTNGVVLDWREVERLRAEVGEKPEFPAPAGGWPAHWPMP